MKETKFPLHPKFTWNEPEKYEHPVQKEVPWKKITSDRKKISGQTITDFYSKEMKKNGWKEKRISGSYHSGSILFQKAKGECEVVFYRGEKEGTTEKPAEGYIIEIRYRC